MREMIVIKEEQNPEDLQKELIACREELRVAKVRYEFILATELRERIKELERKLA
jgi:protein-arginine kinase activator protein McsA